MKLLVNRAFETPVRYFVSPVQIAGHIPVVWISGRGPLPCFPFCLISSVFVFIENQRPEVAGHAITRTHFRHLLPSDCQPGKAVSEHCTKGRIIHGYQPVYILLMFEQTQDRGDFFFQLFAVNYKIQKAVFQQKFTSLKSFRQILFDGLLDHPRSCKANECTWFGNI